MKQLSKGVQAKIQNNVGIYCDEDGIVFEMDEEEVE